MPRLLSQKIKTLKSFNAFTFRLNHDFNSYEVTGSFGKM